MGSAKISVVAVIDLDGKHVRLVVTGPLTMDTQSALHPLIRLARVLTPVTRVVVDLSDARIAEVAALEALARHAWDGHAGHPSQQVRFALPDPACPADAEDLRWLRVEQHSWAASGPAQDPHSTAWSISTARAQPQATPVTAAGRHRTPRSSPARRAAGEFDHAAASAPQPAGGPQPVAVAAEAPTGTVLPFRPRRHRPAARAHRRLPAVRQGSPDQ